MSRTSRTLFLVILFSSLVAMPSLHAFWTDQGTPVCTAINDQNTQQVAPDGAAGAFAVWYDERAGVNNDVYIQRIDAGGNALWTADGIILSTASLSQNYPQVIRDGVDGAIVTWEDTRNSDIDIYAQRIDGQGNMLWTAVGLPVCTITGNQKTPLIISDTQGGAIIVWHDWRNGYYRAYAQRLNESGAPQWTLNGVQICSDPSGQFKIQIGPDGAGGAFIVWEDQRPASYQDLYIQRIDFNGTIQWGAAGVPVCTANHNQFSPQVISDGVDGAIVVWHDYRSYTYDVYAQRFDAAGTVLWATDGVLVSGAPLHQSITYLVSDGANGAIVTWQDYRNGNNDVYVQRINSSGTSLWTADGVPVCTDPGTQNTIQIISDDAGGAILTWHDERNSDDDIYAQRIDASGTVRWTMNGVAVCTSVGNQKIPKLTGDGGGGAIILWVDERNGNEDLYIQQIDASGRTANRPPAIHSVTDVPGDEGGRVVVAWDASPADVLAHMITEYTIWRAIELPPALTMIEKGAHLLGSPAELSGLNPGEIDRPVLRSSTLYDDEFYWQLVGIAPAYYLEQYSYAAETLFDSTAVAWDLHYFQVIAHTADPYLFWISDPDSGYSVDNLAPLAPTGLAGTQSFSPEGMALTWDPNEEEDVIAYSIYRGTSSDFVPAPGNYLTSTKEEELFDDDWTWEAGYWYKINAVDIHGNEGPFAMTGPSDVTGGDPMPVPEATFLAQNYPNPFNPNTIITFGLKKKGHVRLSIYDAAGRLVATLIDGSRSAGKYAAAWNGKDRNGTDTASGVYFYRLRAGDFEETKKMILLR